jgi:hypothetical protein
MGLPSSSIGELGSLLRYDNLVDNLVDSLVLDTEWQWRDDQGSKC